MPDRSGRQQPTVRTYPREAVALIKKLRGEIRNLKARVAELTEQVEAGNSQ